MYLNFLFICLLFVCINLYMHFPIKHSMRRVRKDLTIESPKLPDYCNRYPNVWKNKDMDKDFVDILRYLNNTFMHHNVDYTIAFGTALGYERHGDFIPWDDDMDVVIQKDNSSFIRSFIKKPFCTHNFWGGWKLYKCDNPNAGSYAWKYPFVDVFDNGNTNYHKNSAYDHILFPSNPGIIHGLEIRIPKNISKHLTLRYGEGYMQKCASPFWDHKNEKGIKNAKTMNCSTVVTNCKYE